MITSPSRWRRFFFAPSERHSKHPLAMRRERKDSQRFPLRFWLYAAAVLLYGIAETLSGNWSGPYLTGERGVSAQGASYALTAFWAMVTVGRILFAALSSKIAARWIYAGLPILLVAAFQVVSRADSETSGIVAFGLAGLGCSAFFPLCISLSGQEFPRLAAAMSGEMVAFYQAGYGVAAFGVGPLRTFTGLSFRTIYSFGSLVAGAILVVSLAVALGLVGRRPGFDSLTLRQGRHRQRGSILMRSGIERNMKDCSQFNRRKI